MAQSAVPEPEVESEKEVGSDGEDEDDEVCETARKSFVNSSFSSVLYPTRFKHKFTFFLRTGTVKKRNLLDQMWKVS